MVILAIKASVQTTLKTLVVNVYAILDIKLLVTTSHVIVIMIIVHFRLILIAVCYKNIPLITLLNILLFVLYSFLFGYNPSYS